mgnify:CR=1 FL=1
MPQRRDRTAASLCLQCPPSKRDPARQGEISQARIEEQKREDEMRFAKDEVAQQGLRKTGDNPDGRFTCGWHCELVYVNALQSRTQQRGTALRQPLKHLPHGHETHNWQQTGCARRTHSDAKRVTQTASHNSSRNICARASQLALPSTTRLREHETRSAGLACRLFEFEKQHTTA